MPEKQTLQRARADKNAGKSASTQAGEFIREQIHHIRQGRHGARSTRQAIAIGLSEARRAGVELSAPSPQKTSSETRAKAQRDYARGHGAPRRSAATVKRARASENALKREGTTAASPQALSRQARSAAARRSPAERSAAARRASKTKGARGRSNAAKRAARTRRGG
jgi:hypothetical protein